MDEPSGVCGLGLRERPPAAGPAGSAPNPEPGRHLAVTPRPRAPSSEPRRPTASARRTRSRHRASAALFSLSAAVQARFEPRKPKAPRNEPARDHTAAGSHPETHGHLLHLAGAPRLRAEMGSSGPGPGVGGRVARGQGGCGAPVLRHHPHPQLQRFLLGWSLQCAGRCGHVSSTGKAGTSRSPGVAASSLTTLQGKP